MHGPSPARPDGGAFLATSTLARKRPYLVGTTADAAPSRVVASGLPATIPIFGARIDPQPRKHSAMLIDGARRVDDDLDATFRTPPCLEHVDCQGEPLDDPLAVGMWCAS